MKKNAVIIFLLIIANALIAAAKISGIFKSNVITYTYKVSALKNK